MIDIRSEWEGRGKYMEKLFLWYVFNMRIFGKYDLNQVYIEKKIDVK